MNTGNFAARSIAYGPAVSTGWLGELTIALQTIVGLCTHGDAPGVVSVLARLRGPSSPAETLALRCLIYDTLLALVETNDSTRDEETRAEVLRTLCAIRSSRDIFVTFRHALGLLLDLPAHDQTSGVAEAARRRIDRLYDTRLTVRGLADELGVTVPQLERAFRRAQGVPIRVYMQRLRVRRGLDLVATGVKVEAAALMVGYRSKKDFYRAVRTETGLTPGQVRPRRDESPVEHQVASAHADVGERALVVDAGTRDHPPGPLGGECVTHRGASRSACRRAPDGFVGWTALLEHVQIANDDPAARAPDE